MLFQKGGALRHQLYNLTWTHYRYLLPLNDINAIKYYVDISSMQNLSYRQLRERIKTKEYERLGEKTELEEPKVDTLIKNPILIKVKNKNDKLTEYALHKLVMR